jgi:hypothetical protein
MLRLDFFGFFIEVYVKKCKQKTAVVQKIDENGHPPPFSELYLYTRATEYILYFTGNLFSSCTEDICCKTVFSIFYWHLRTFFMQNLPAF